MYEISVYLNLIIKLNMYYGIVQNAQMRMEVWAHMSLKFLPDANEPPGPT